MSEDDAERNEASHPSDGYEHTVPKSEAENVPAWAEHLEGGETIRWRSQHVDGIQESRVLGFSSTGNLAQPVIPAVDVDEDFEAGDTICVNEKHWVPDDAESIAKVELEYRQRISVSIPVDEMPDGCRGALDLVKNADPEFVADALPRNWDTAVSVGEFDVVDVSEERGSDE